MTETTSTVSKAISRMEDRILQYVYTQDDHAWRFRHRRHGEFTQALRRCQRVVDDCRVGNIALRFLTPPGRKRPVRVQALIEYLAQRFANEPWAQMRREI